MVSAKTANAVRIDEASDGLVVLTTADADRFVLTQRELVGAIRGSEDVIGTGQRALAQFQEMVTAIQAWCAGHTSVGSCVMFPRMDDLLVLVVCNGEDEEGALDTALSALDLGMFSRNKFRVSWMMLRASEAAGAASFIKPESARLIYRAK